MATRQQYTMDKKQLARLLEASKVTPYYPFEGPRALAPVTAAWKALSDEMGFQWDTVKPVGGPDLAIFTAEPKA